MPITNCAVVFVSRSKWFVLIVALMLTLGAAAGVLVLGQRADASRVAQQHVGSLKEALGDLQSAPFDADPTGGESPAAAQARIQSDEAVISGGLTNRQVGSSGSILSSARADLASIEPVVASIYRVAVTEGLSAAAVHHPHLVPGLQRRLTLRSAALSVLFGKLGRIDAGRAERDRANATLGAAGAMLVLLLAFGFFYLRSAASHEAVERLADEKEVLLGVSRVEARTDALTGLGNRRALTSDLAAAIAQASGSDELLVSMFDLDGFKQYNDTFGHAAGDALLHRLGGCLAARAMEHSGSAYRMGGDEFCLLARTGPQDAERLINDGLEALEEAGDSWHIGASHGAVWIPSEATTESQAMKLADERMYANKASRSSASRQVADALLQVLVEQDVLLDEHL
jgi:diguanylate cyclase (GGDEF)-like protein